MYSYLLVANRIRYMHGYGWPVEAKIARDCNGGSLTSLASKSLAVIRKHPSDEATAAVVYTYCDCSVRSNDN